MSGPPQPPGPPGPPDAPDCPPNRQYFGGLGSSGVIYFALVGLQVIAALYLRQLNSPILTIQSAERAARVCNFVSLMLMVSIGFFVYESVYYCSTSPMFAIILLFLDFIWVSRAMGYKKRARLLRYNRSLDGSLTSLMATSSDPLLRQQGPRDLNAPDIADDSAVAVAVVLAQPVGNPSSHDSEAPLVPTAAKPVAIWEGDVEEV